MGDVEVDPAHQKLPDTKRSSVASRPSIKAAPRNSGTRNTRILAIDVSNSAEQEAADGELADIGGDADRERRHGGAGRRDAPGREQAGDQRDVKQELERG